tara:strand:- start:1756 stop:3003 length:1248 start_codon:yes stop_codon:yes gene_type:complete
MNLKYIKEIFIQTKELIGSQSVIALISLIQVSYVVKKLGVENFGVIALLIAIPNLVFRSIHANHSDVILLTLKNGKNIVSESLFLNFILGLFSFTLSMFVFLNPINPLFSINQLTSIDVLPVIIVLYLFSKIFQTFSETSKGILVFKNKMKSFSFLESSSIVFRFVLIIILLEISPTIQSYLFANIFYFLYSGFFSLFLIKKEYELNKFSYDEFKQFVVSIKRSFNRIRINQIISLIPQHFDIILLSVVSDFGTVGIYQFAKRLVEPINYVIYSFTPWIQNKLKNNSKDFNIQSFVKMILIPISFLLFSLYVFLGEFIILQIGSESFLNSYNPMIILCIGFIIYLLTFWIRQSLLLNNLIHFHSYGRLIYCSAFLVLSFFLANSFKEIGISASLTIAIFLQKTFEYIIYRKKLKS